MAGPLPFVVRASARLVPAGDPANGAVRWVACRHAVVRGSACDAATTSNHAEDAAKAARRHVTLITGLTSQSQLGRPFQALSSAQECPPASKPRPSVSSPVRTQEEILVPQGRIDLGVSPAWSQWNDKRARPGTNRLGPLVKLQEVAGIGLLCLFRSFCQFDMISLIVTERHCRFSLRDLASGTIAEPYRLWRVVCCLRSNLQYMASLGGLDLLLESVVVSGCVGHKHLIHKDLR